MCPMQENLWSLLQPSLQRHAGNPAWICRRRDARRVLGYRQLHDAALAIAARLRERGIGDGDSIAITAPNGPEFTAAALAAWKIGANIAPIHTGNSAHERAQQQRALAPAILLVHDAAPGDAGMDIDIADISLCRARIAAEAARPAARGGDKLALRICTSGSAGAPKIVQLSHANLASNMRAACKIGKFTARDRFISLLPFSHAMGLMGNMLLPLYHGAAMVSPRALNAAEILETLRRENISVLIAVPRLFRNVMLGLEKKFREGGAALGFYRAALRRMPPAMRRRLNAPIRGKLGGALNVWVSGGSHLDARIIRYYHDLGLPLRQGYGLTETSPLASMQEEFDRAPGGVGRPVEGVRVKINAPDAGGCGEIWVAGPNVMLGYEDAQQTREAMQDGWFKTGDLGRLDASGRLFLTGRLKRLIVTEAGKNVYPEELETLLERDAAVKEAGVLEIAARPACVLAMHEHHAAIRARAVLAAFNRRVSPHNRIARFALVDELPRTPLGKMALRQLPEIFARNEVK
ncbi:MAG: acyl--CoA ligase [Gammaproteobacteria bacterium]